MTPCYMCDRSCAAFEAVDLVMTVGVELAGKALKNVSVLLWDQRSGIF